MHNVLGIGTAEFARAVCTMSLGLALDNLSGFDPPVHTRDGTTLQFESRFKYLEVNMQATN